MESAVDDLVVGFAEAIFFKSHSGGEGAKQIDVGAAFTEGLDGLGRHLKVVVSVGGLEIFVFEESCGRKNDVGVVGGVGEELFVDDGEKIGAF